MAETAVEYDEDDITVDITLTRTGALTSFLDVVCYTADCRCI